MASSNSKSGTRLYKSKTCEERFIKVNQIHYDYRIKEQSSCCRSVPWINVKGFWLKDAGFEINTPVKIRVMQGCLVLTTEEQSN